MWGTSSLNNVAVVYSINSVASHPQGSCKTTAACELILWSITPQLRFNKIAIMTDQFAFTYPSPLEGYENKPPLPTETSEDGKSLKNPQTAVLSNAYETFVDPLSKGRRGGL